MSVSNLTVATTMGATCTPVSKTNTEQGGDDFELGTSLEISDPFDGSSEPVGQSGSPPPGLRDMVARALDQFYSDQNSRRATAAFTIAGGTCVAAALMLPQEYGEHKLWLGLTGCAFFLGAVVNATLDRFGYR